MEWENRWQSARGPFQRFLAVAAGLGSESPVLGLVFPHPQSATVHNPGKCNVAWHGELGRIIVRHKARSSSPSTNGIDYTGAVSTKPSPLQHHEVVTPGSVLPYHYALTKFSVATRHRQSQSPHRAVKLPDPRCMCAVCRSGPALAAVMRRYKRPAKGLSGIGDVFAAASRESHLRR